MLSCLLRFILTVCVWISGSHTVETDTNFVFGGKSPFIFTMSCNAETEMFVASFVAINERSQKFMCSLVDLPLIAVHKTRSTKTLGSPTELYYIQGDGNCLFRSLSYALTRRQIYHNIIRHKIINHMKDIESLLRPHMNGSLEVRRLP